MHHRAGPTKSGDPDHPPRRRTPAAHNQRKGKMIKAITKYLSEIGREGGKASNPRKGFGTSPLSAEARAKAAATRSANRARDERESMRQAVMRMYVFTHTLAKQSKEGGGK